MCGPVLRDAGVGHFHELQLVNQTINLQPEHWEAVTQNTFAY